MEQAATCKTLKQSNIEAAQAAQGEAEHLFGAIQRQARFNPALTAQKPAHIGARLSFVPAGFRLIREPFSLVPEPLRFIADKSSLISRPVRFVAGKSSFRAQSLSFALGPLHFRVARLSFVPAGFRLILEPFSLMPEPLRFIADKSSLMAHPVRFVAGRISMPRYPFNLSRGNDRQLRESVGALARDWYQTADRIAASYRPFTTICGAGSLNPVLRSPSDLRASSVHF
jgi:hypothetical protein